MKFGKTLIGALLVGILALAPSASSITISVSGDAGGLTENINAGDRDSVYGSVAIGPGSLSNSISGSGSLKESHWVSNSAGASAGVGVEIRKAESYTYGYSLKPGIGSYWPESKYPVVSAGETLDVVNANYINAYAKASNINGEAAGVSTILVDPGNKASLTGYLNSATASKEMVSAFQNARSASVPGGAVQTEADSQLSQLKLFPFELRMENAYASTTVKAGSVNGYTDKAAVSNYGVAASQHIDSASGKRINTNSRSTSYLVSLFNGLKRSNTEVNTMTFGDLTGYDGICKTSLDLVEVQQSGHIAGTFTSTATAGSASKTRKSNYGTMYDFNMQAKKDASGSYATGNLGYYVDNVSPIANRIQGAVDASESGDAVNVAPGTYFENVHIDKSLSLKGAGASDTIVDGQHLGSVFTIGKNDPNVDVALSGLTIQGGTGTPVESWPGFSTSYGGGIQNFGTMKLKDSTISGNTANYGGGVSNAGTAMVTDSTVSGNTAGNGGGIFNSAVATLNIDGSIISGNSATDGGGVCNWGTATIKDSVISGNLAGYNGGGVDNRGSATIIDSIVSENSAYWYGGGVYSDGMATITNSSIFGNSANLYGGGVVNYGTATITSSTISGNQANLIGGVENDGTAVITDSIISGNRANLGGGVFNRGTATIENSIISGNSAEYDGGGVLNDGMAIIANSTISGNSAKQWGGGVFSRWGATTIKGSNISGNSAQFGGGVGIYYGGTAVITDSTIFRNSAEWWGGGILNDGVVTITGSDISENQAEYGGGILTSGTSTVTSSTISGNSAKQWGGGVLNWGMATISGSNITGNSAVGDGGGIFNGGMVDIPENSAITQNIADSDNDGVGTGGGIYRHSGILNFIDANGDGVVDPNTIVFDNHLGNGDVNNIEPPLPP